MKFRISDIPDKKSTRELVVGPEEFSLGEIEHGEIHLTVHFTKIMNTLQLRFEAQTTLQLVCDRSLELFEYPVSTTYDMLFRPDIDKHEDEELAVKPLSVSSNTIDIEQEVRDSILLSIPIKKLHPKFIKDDGSQTEYSASFGLPDKSQDEESTDPRWEALKKLKNNK